jgi:hypothetical protein
MLLAHVVGAVLHMRERRPELRFKMKADYWERGD